MSIILISIFGILFLILKKKNTKISNDIELENKNYSFKITEESFKCDTGDVKILKGKKFLIILMINF
jgi:hypothetical protein